MKFDNQARSRLKFKRNINGDCVDFSFDREKETV